MTELHYLKDTYRLTSISHITDIGHDDHGDHIILSATIYYPQGGGQPSDTGVIEGANGKWLVEKCRIDEHGIVYHYGRIIEGTLTPKEAVKLMVDKDSRMRNARTHSAGHLIDVAMGVLGLDWQPTKGYHFSDGPYVEYDGVQPPPLDIEARLEEILRDLISRDIAVIVTTDTSVSSPSGKSPRYVSYAGYPGCGCGGTHMRSSGEIGSISIRKVKQKDGKWRVSYSVG